MLWPIETLLMDDGLCGVDCLLHWFMSDGRRLYVVFQGTRADNIPYEKKVEGAKKGSQKSAESRQEASERRHAEHPESYGSS